MQDNSGRTGLESPITAGVTVSTTENPGNEVDCALVTGQREEVTGSAASRTGAVEETKVGISALARKTSYGSDSQRIPRLSYWKSRSGFRRVRVTGKTKLADHQKTIVLIPMEVRKILPTWGSNCNLHLRMEDVIVSKTEVCFVQMDKKH